MRVFTVIIKISKSREPNLKGYKCLNKTQTFVFTGGELDYYPPMRLTILGLVIQNEDRGVVVVPSILLTNTGVELGMEWVK